MSVPQTSDGFWRSFDRDHEALPQPGRDDGLKTTDGWYGPNVAHFVCHTCGMPAHMEHHKILKAGTQGMLPVVPLAFDRMEQNIWVPRHGPAPIRATHPQVELRGTTPVIVLPGATVMMELSNQHKRHLPDRFTLRMETLRSGYVRRWAIPLCGVTTSEQRAFQLGECMHAKVCGNCLESPSQL